jgi:hypothetical protein
MDADLELLVLAVAEVVADDVQLRDGRQICGVVRPRDVDGSVRSSRGVRRSDVFA